MSQKLGEESALVCVVVKEAKNIDFIGDLYEYHLRRWGQSEWVGGQM